MTLEEIYIYLLLFFSFFKGGGVTCSLLWRSSLERPLAAPVPGRITENSIVLHNTGQLIASK